MTMAMKEKNEIAGIYSKKELNLLLN